MFFFDIFEGNPGALSFFIQAHESDSFGAEIAFKRMMNNNITGDKLYIIWNDCCDRDTKRAIHVMKNHTIEDILKHINYENGRGIRYTEEEIITKPFSKKYMLDNGNHSISGYKPYEGYVIVDMTNMKIENAEDMLLQKCISVIKEILQENKETFLHIEEDKRHPHCIKGCWRIFLPTGDVDNA